MRTNPALFLAGLLVFLASVYVFSSAGGGAGIVSAVAAATDKVETVTKLSASGQEVEAETIKSILPDEAWTALASAGNFLLGLIAVVLSWSSKGLHLLANLLEIAGNYAEQKLDEYYGNEEETDEDQEATTDALEQRLWDQLDSDKPDEQAIKRILEALADKKIFSEVTASQLIRERGQDATTQVKASKFAR